MTKQQREDIIASLKEMQGRGEFDGFDEETMDFNKCDDEDLQYYHDEWLNKDYLLTKDDFTKVENLFEAIDNWEYGYTIGSLEDVNADLEEMALNEMTYNIYDQITDGKKTFAILTQD